jgi:hypothetical protein
MKSDANVPKSRDVERYPKQEFLPEIIEIPPAQILRKNTTNREKNTTNRETVDLRNSKITILESDLENE